MFYFLENWGYERRLLVRQREDVKCLLKNFLNRSQDRGRGVDGKTKV